MQPKNRGCSIVQFKRIVSLPERTFFISGMQHCGRGNAIEKHVLHVARPTVDGWFGRRRRTILQFYVTYHKWANIMPKTVLFCSLPFSFTDSFESIGSILMDTNGYPSDEAKKALIGLSRDLRGLAFSSNTRASYMMFFEWMWENPPTDQFYWFEISLKTFISHNPL